MANYESHGMAERIAFARPPMLAGTEILRVDACTTGWSAVRDGYVLTRVRDGHGLADFGVKKGNPVSAGGLTLMAPGDIHRGTCVGTSSFDVVYLPAEKVESRARELLGNAPFWFPESHLRRPPPMDSLATLIDQAGPGGDAFALEGALASVIDDLLVLVSRSRRVPVHSRDQTVAAKLRQRLDMTFETPINIGEAAADLGVTVEHLVRVFKAELGVPPYEYVTHLRVQRAKHLIARGIPLKQVAPLVGYYDHSQLHRHFRRIAAVTPGAFARATRSRP